MAPKSNTDLALLRKDIEYLRKDIQECHAGIVSSEEKMATKESVEDIKKEIEKLVTKDKFEPVQKIVYTMVILVLTSVLGAIIALVIQQPR